MRIATMEAEKEDAENITVFLSLFLEHCRKLAKTQSEIST